MGAGFGFADWAVVAACLVAITLVGHRMSGRAASLRDFFLGGRKLPWWAVSASIVATEISAVTYVSLPSVVFRQGGDMTYLQLGLIGSFIGRAVVGYVLVPAYYEREIYSPYDYMGGKLGEGVRRTATTLFSIGGVLGQAARVYLTAVVLGVILHDELAWIEARLGLDPLVSAVASIGVVALAWTWLGGIATVVWTDAILFLLFLGGLLVTLVVIGRGVDGGLPAAIAAGAEAGKFRLFDLSLDPTRPYTLWVAIFASSWLTVGAYGTDQLMAQRMFCCASARDARKAILWSIVAMGVTFLAAVVGVGLWAWYREHGMSESALALYRDAPDRVFPIFIREALPTGIKGLVLASVFAAAISSLDSILAALSQTTLSVLPRRWRARGTTLESERTSDSGRSLRASRVLVALWGVGLCTVAVGMDTVQRRYDSILDLALAMATYTWGALLAGFMLAWVPPLSRRFGGSGYPFGAALSVLTVFAIVWHEPWAARACWIASTAVLLAWVALRLRPALARGDPLAPWLARSVALACGLALSIILCYHGVFPGGGTLAWPWNVPAGTLVALVGSLALADPRTRP